jgi:hypothetical protein
LGQCFARRVKIHRNVIIRLVLDGEPKTGSDEEEENQRGYDQKNCNGCLHDFQVRQF